MNRKKEVMTKIKNLLETSPLNTLVNVGFQAEHKLTDSFIYFLKEIEGETGKRVSEFSSTEVGVVEQKINTYLKTMRHRVNKFPYAQKHNHYQDRVFVKFIKENATISKEQG